MENENKTVEVTDHETFQNYIKGKWWLYIDYSTYKALKDKLPPYDMVEVVRCKDCKFAEPLVIYSPFWKDDYQCQRLVDFENVKAWDYCSRGERREDNGKTG